VGLRTTSDAVGVDAIRRFLRFQIEDHKRFVGGTTVGSVGRCRVPVANMVKVIEAHAKEISGFVANGMPAMMHGMME
jgi:hypothetical protein